MHRYSLETGFLTLIIGLICYTFSYYDQIQLCMSTVGKLWPNNWYMGGRSSGYHILIHFLKEAVNLSTPEPEVKLVVRTWCGCEEFQGLFQSACRPLCFYGVLENKVKEQNETRDNNENR